MQNPLKKLGHHYHCYRVGGFVVRRIVLFALILAAGPTMLFDCGLAQAAEPAIDPVLEERLENIEDLAKSHPDRARAALAEFESKTSLAADRKLQLRVELVHAWIENSSGSTDAALQRLDAMAGRLATVGDSNLRARSLNLRANVLSDLNRFTEMGETVKAEGREAEAAGHEGLLAAADIDRAWFACQVGEYTEGLTAILSARLRNKRPRQSAETAQATAVLANMVDDTKTALDSAQSAARIYREIDDPIGESEALVMIAASERQLGRPKEAEVAARRALKLRQLGNDRLGQATALIVLAGAQFELDQVAEALDSNAQALALIPQEAKVYLAIARTGRARILVLSGRFAEARALLDSAADVADEEVGRGMRLLYHESLGRAAIALGDFRLARAEDRMVQSLHREHTQGSIERQLGALRVRMEQEQGARDNALLRDKAALASRAARMTEVAFALAVLLLAGLAWAYMRQRGLARRLEALTQTDALTGLLNRRGLFEIGHRMLERCQHDGLPFAVLIVDVDKFKPINDEFGHPVGDDALACVARVLEAHVRPGDRVGRYGGEEFAVLLSASASSARMTAERLREAVASMAPTWHHRAPRITISGGLAMASPEQSFEQLVGIADEALYRAKQLGRNRIEGDDSPVVASQTS